MRKEKLQIVRKSEIDVCEGGELGRDLETEESVCPVQPVSMGTCLKKVLFLKGCWVLSSFPPKKPH